MTGRLAASLAIRRRPFFFGPCEFAALHLRRSATKTPFRGTELVLNQPQILGERSQFGVNGLLGMVGVVDFEAIFKDEFGFLGDSAQFRVLIGCVGSENGVRQALQRILEFRDALHDFRPHHLLRLDVAIERDFAFDLVDLLGNRGFVPVRPMDNARDDACQRIAVRHERIIEPGTIKCEICWKALRAYNAGMAEAKLVVVRSFGSRAEAQLAKGALEDAAIPAMTQADTAGGMREHLAWSGAGFQVWVREEDAAAAREVLTPMAENNDGEKSSNGSR